MSQENSPESIVMSETVYQSALDMIDTIRSIIPGLVEITDEEVKTLNKISDGDKVFISDCLVEAPAAKGMLPIYYSISDVKDNDASHDQLFVLEDKLFELYVDVRRNRMARADKAYFGVSAFYKFIAAAVDHKVPLAAAIYKRLQDYHKKKVEAANAKKRKIEAQKKAEEEARQAEENDRKLDKATA